MKNFKRFIAIILTLVLCLSFSTVFASAATPEETTNVQSRSMTPHSESLTCFALSTPILGATFTATDTRITASAKAGNIADSTVIIVLQVKSGHENVFYDVATASLVCDGTTHTIFNGVTIIRGNTYRFTYRLDSTTTSTVVTLGAVMFTP